MEQALEAMGIRPHAELTHSAVELFGDPMTPECQSSPTVGRSSQAGIHMELGVYDVVGAHCASSPPTFGKYANCHVERRCLGCEEGCAGEGALLDFAASEPRPILLVLVGGSLLHPSWLRVVVLDHGKRWNGGVFIPVTFRHQRGVVLEPESGGACLVVTAEGLLVTETNTGKPWLVSAFDRARFSFCSALSRFRQPDSEVTGHPHAFEGQGS
ncbi:hypothetical protein [Sandarakinorhabdus sp. DWP1-3-1]|uniref:hypothetical protein n=1 Tax=Sandarakinorhabdus sp. DWP1-3-1 TaxID=2804627 RepID=UPI003CF7029F